MLHLISLKDRIEIIDIAAMGGVERTEQMERNGMKI